MYEFIEGKLHDLTPAYAVINTNGIGFLIQISLHSYSQLNELPDKNTCTLFIHQVIREDAHVLYGFQTKNERELFRLLITVSGVGANTARMMLSSMTPDEISVAIAEANVNLLKNIKGIGIKTAQRIIVDLKDKIGTASSPETNFLVKDNKAKDEALHALITLGFTKTSVEKVLDKIIASGARHSVEDLIKQALKSL